MAQGVNKVILIGHLGRDPEVKTLESGSRVASFSIATTESYKDREGNRKDQTEWHNVSLWGGLADVAEKYLKKGNQIYLEGRIRTRSYEDSGVKKFFTEIIGNNMTMLGGRRDDAGDNISSGGAIENPPNADPGDDLPF